MLKGILLDIDGTLVKSNDAHASAWIETFSQFGYDISFEEIRPLMGMGADKILSLLLPQISPASKIGKAISDTRKDIFLTKYASGLTPTRGARKLVETLYNKRYRLIAATSSGKEELSVLLKAAQVDTFIHEATTKNDVKASKPASDIVSQALTKLKLMAHESLLIGDTPYDISSAKKSGVRTIALRSGGFSDETLTGAYAIYDTPYDLASNLDTVFSSINYDDFTNSWPL